MDNPGIDGDKIPLLHTDPDDDYDDYKTPNTSRIGETLFIVPGSTEQRNNINFTAETKSKTI